MDLRFQQYNIMTKKKIQQLKQILANTFHYINSQKNINRMCFKFIVLILNKFTMINNYFPCKTLIPIALNKANGQVDSYKKHSNC